MKPSSSPSQQATRGISEHLIVHFHIFKNAGTSVDKLLNLNFPGQCQSIEAEHAWQALSTDAFSQFIQSLSPQIQAISSHTARPAQIRLTDRELHPIIFLRDPVERAKSVYSFARKQPASDNKAATRIAKEHDFDGFIRWRLQQPGCVIKNFQTIFLSGRQLNMKTAHANRDDLQAACTLLTKLPAFGIVEEFETSIKAIFNQLSMHFPTLNNFLVHENRSQIDNNSSPISPGEVRDQLCRQTFDQLIEANGMDIELYRVAHERFNRMNN